MNASEVNIVQFSSVAPFVKSHKVNIVGYPMDCASTSPVLTTHKLSMNRTLVINEQNILWLGESCMDEGRGDWSHMRLKSFGQIIPDAKMAGQWGLPDSFCTLVIAQNLFNPSLLIASLNLSWQEYHHSFPVPASDGSVGGIEEECFGGAWKLPQEATFSSWTRSWALLEPESISCK